MRLIIAVFVLFSFGPSKKFSKQFEVLLPKGVSVHLSNSWKVFSASQVVSLDSLTNSKLQEAGQLHAEGNLNFAANFYNSVNETIGIFNIRYYPDIRESNEEIASFTKEELELLNNQLFQNISTGVKANGGKVLEWNGSKFEKINSKLYIVSKYSRKGANGSVFKVQLIRMINGSKSFTVTLSYRSEDDSQMSKIIDSVKQSISQK